MHDRIENFFASNDFSNIRDNNLDGGQKTNQIQFSGEEFSVFLDSENAKKVSILYILEEKPVSDLLTDIVDMGLQEQLEKWAPKVLE